MIVDDSIPSPRAKTMIAIFVGWLLSGRFEVGSGLETDITCLKSLRDSVQDPFGHLSSWDFAAPANRTAGAGFICVFPGIDCWNAYENRVINLRLDHMGLRGHFPAGLRSCATLTGLDISNNQLSGPIPSEIHLILRYIVSLDLSNNQFSGLIPPSIASCGFLYSLRLDVNRFGGGPIPNEIGLMPHIDNFNVSGNTLTGPVPTFLLVTAIFDFRNNPGLCGHPLEPCPSSSDHHNNIILQPNFFRGFMTGWAVSMSLVFFLCLFAIPDKYVKKLTDHLHRVNKKKRSQINRQSLQPERLAPAPAPNDMNNSLRITKMEKYATRISFAELSDATGGFSQDSIIGIGKTGTTYKATIQNGWLLAVKWLFDSDQLDRRIASEILTLGRLRHRRLVPLIGFCLENNATFLVYKYISNGNLYDWLHQRQGDIGGETIRQWPLRIRIAVGVAEGLAWLHQKNCSLSVIHADISSKCILLDKKFEPKISNFWEAKFIHHQSKDSVSISRFFPRWDSHQDQLESDKRDVYFFGILLFELITGKEPEELASSIRNNLSSPDSFMAQFSVALLFGMDETLRGQGFEDEIYRCLEIAKNCVRSNPGQRPSMVQVHATLAAFAHISNNYTSDSEIISF